MNNKQFPNIPKRFPNRILRAGTSPLILTALFLSIVFLSIGLLDESAKAQSARSWNYVTTITEGVKFYVGNDRRIVSPAKHITAWERIVKPDGSSVASFVEWDCAEKRRLTVESTFYNADKTVVGTRKQIASWMPVTPGSAADLLFARVCRSAAPFETAEIIVSRANLRVSPDASAPVVRAANRGATFRIIAGTGRGGWFNVVDEATQEDYWLFADDFRVTAAAEMKKLVKNKSLGKGKNTNKNTSKTADKKTNKTAGKKKS